MRPDFRSGSSTPFERCPTAAAFPGRRTNALSLRLLGDLAAFDGAGRQIDVLARKGRGLLADAGITGPTFEEWQVAERATLHDFMLQALGRLLPLKAREQRAALSKRLAALDPLAKASHLALMQAHAEMGDRA